MHDQSWGGEYYFDDVAVHKLDHKKRAQLRNSNIGFVFQSYHLLDDQTVFENLELPLSYRDVNKKDRQSIVCDTLDRFQIVGKKDLFPQPAIRRSAATRGDRPRGSCKPAHHPRRRAHRKSPFEPGQRDHGDIQKLNDEGTTIVQVTHSEVNAAYGNRIIRLEDGWIAKSAAA